MADWGAGGTTNLTTRTAIRAEMPVSVKSPETPHSFVSGGEIRRERAKVRPIEAPTMAIALVRTCTRTLSAMNAVTAAEIAPAPCSMRPNDPDVGARRSEETAECKDDESENDDGFAAKSI